MGKYTYDGQPSLIFHHKILHNHSPVGPLSHCQIYVSTTGYVVQVLLREVERGDSSLDTLKEVCTRYSPFFKFCPGIELETYEKYYQIIRFDIWRMESPVHRIDSKLCPMWFKLGKTVSAQKRELEEVLCCHCCRLLSDLDRQVKRTEAESPERKKKRQNPSSKARITYMSPASQKKRKQKTQVERDTHLQKLQSSEHTILPLDNEQDEEMMAAVNTIENKFADDLEKLFLEGESHGVGQRIREIWNADRRASCHQYKNDQSHNSK